MKFKQTRLVTHDVANLTRFYEALTGGMGTVLNVGYVEFQSNPCEGLAIADPASIRSYGPGVAEPTANRSVILDFQVADVDAEYLRLRDIVSDWVQLPTVQPWGSRSILLRDPDGNLINMFALPSSTVKGPAAVTA